MGRRIAAAVAIVGVAAGAGLAVAAPAAAATYTVSGTVTIPADADAAWSDEIYVAIEGDANVTVKADASTGAFSIPGLDDGTYSLKAYAYPPGGTGEYPNLVTEYYGDTYDYAEREVIVINGASATGKNIDLDYGAILRGTLFAVSPVTTPDLQGAQVTATGPGGVQYRATGDGTTGQYAITGMIPGAYTLRVDATSYNGPGGGAVTPNIASVADGSYFDEPAPHGLAATSGSASLTRNLVVYPAFTVSGVVDLAEGVDTSLLAGVTVRLPSEYYATPPSAAVDPETGAWSLTGLPLVGYYSATASGPGLIPQPYSTFVTNPTGDQSLGTLVLAAGQTVSGVVSITGVEYVADALASTRITLSSAAYTRTNIRVDAAGNWSTDPVPPGSYTVFFDDPYHHVFASEYYNDVYDAADATPVVVASSPVIGINAALEPTRHFTAVPVPTVAGTKGLGGTLTATTGTWKAVPDSFAYQWYRNGAAITGATKATYTLTASDPGKSLTVKVTATKAGYTTTARTSAGITIPNVFSTTPTPTISGSTTKGSKLTAKPGTWSNAPALTYQWFRSGSAISGATKATYTLTANDLGKSLTVKVTATKAGYTTTAKTSAGTAIPYVFTKTSAPTITGTLKSGSTLTAKVTAWSPKASGLTYQWYRSGTAISKATKTTYKLTTADRGKTITVKVTGTLKGYTTVTTTSAGKAIPKVFTTTPTPKVTGTLKSGKTLTAKAGTWKPKATKLTYQWYRNGKAITKATKTTYKLTASDKGKKITVKVTATKSGYLTTTKTSAAKTIAK